MQVILLDKARIADEWPVIAATLGPSLAYGPKMTLRQLRRQVDSGAFWIVGGETEGAKGYLAFHLFEEEGETCCFASYLAGSIDGGPKQMIRTMRRLMEAFEASCRAADVKQVFIGGRDWGRVFPDYELTGDVPNRRRKRL